MSTIDSILTVKADQDTEKSARADLQVPDPKPETAKALLELEKISKHDHENNDGTKSTG
jgi:hypothetical protein